MKSLQRLVRKLDDAELLHISNAIDIELIRRRVRSDSILQTAGDRASDRHQMYHEGNRASAPPMELPEVPQHRAA